MARLEIRLFGHLEFSVDGNPWRFSAPPRAAVVLAYLLLHAGESVSRSALATIVWPDDAEEEARGKLRRHLHRIARALPEASVPWIAVTASTVRFEPRDDVWIDVAAFVDAAADPRRRADAIAVYRGELLEDLYEDWLLVERERLRAEFLDLCYEAALQTRRDRDFDAAIRYAERMLAVDEWREDALRMVMSVRYESGDRSGALAAFERFNAKLRSEMRVDPMVETLALRAAILENAALPGRSSFGEDVTMPSSAAMPFVGREPELESLDAQWLRAARGHGTTLFVGGAAGIGKSRLVGELAAKVTAQGGRALVGGTSNPQAYPYEPIADALRRGLALIAQSKTDSVWLSSLAALIPELHGALPELPVAETLEPAHARLRLFEAIVRCVEHLARVRPLLLVLEDVHWAGETTFDALEFLARRIGMMPVLTVITYRIEEVDAAHGLTTVRNRLQSERRAGTLVLGALDAHDVDELVRRGSADAPGDLAASVFALSEGNPLFVNQLLRAYVERGERPSERSAARTVGEAIASRLESLDESSRRLAEVGAICGRTFTVEMAGRVIGCPEDEILDALGTLIDRGIVREAGGTAFAYAFTHALIGAAVYQATSQEARVARHRRIAQLLARATASGPQAWAEVARHWRGAGEGARAADAYVRAGQAALDIYARHEAVASARAAVELAESDAVRFEALRIAAIAQMRAGDFASWDADLHAMEAIAQRLGPDQELVVLKQRERYASQVTDLDLKAKTVAQLFELARRYENESYTVEALIAQGGLGMGRVELGEARAALTQALEMAIRRDDADQISRVRELLIQVLVRFGDAGAALAELERHKRHLERADAPIESKLRILNPESIIAAQHEDGPALERIGNEMLDFSTRAGDAYYEARAHGVLAHSAYIRGDFAGIWRHYEKAIPLFELVGDVRSLHVTYANWSEFELRVGRAEAALKHLDLAERFGGQLNLPDGICVLAVNRARALLLMGCFEPALEYARQAQAITEELSEPRFMIETAVTLGALEWLTGAPGAVARIERALAVCLEAEDWHNATDALCWLVDAYVAQADMEAASIHGSRLAEIFAAHEDAAVHATRICWTLSRLAAAAGSVAEEREWTRRGQAFLADALRRFEDPSDAQAYSELPFNRQLLAHANGRETRTARHSS